MATISLQKVRKVYANGVEAVREIDLEVADGEFMVLVGPSGCGKTTVLRMVAGLEDITNGIVMIGDRVVNYLTPKRRDVAMVFQNYALYPHMTVAENIAFALKMQRIHKEEIRRRVGEAAQILGLTEWLNRKPGQLSGGQRQRVAMGRAIVRQPQAFLMDEPLSNLDAKMRVQMRAEVTRIQRQLGVATLYVTHDQVEAMTMGDRVSVMRDGNLQQCSDPQTLYDRPDNLFVAAFIGSPAMNLFDAGVGVEAGFLQLGSQRLELSDRARATHPGILRYSGQRVVIGIRPEDLTLPRGQVSDHEGAGVLEGDVDLVEALGSELLVHFHIDAKRVLSEEPQGETDSLSLLGGSTARVEPRPGIHSGSVCRFALDVNRIHYFDPESGNAIWD